MSGLPTIMVAVVARLTGLLRRHKLFGTVQIRAMFLCLARARPPSPRHNCAGKRSSHLSSPNASRGATNTTKAM